MKTLYIADIKSQSINGASEGHYFPVAANYYTIFKNSCKTLIAGGPIYATKFATNTYLLKYNTNEQDSIIKNKIKIFRNMMDLFSHKNENYIIIIQSSAVATALIGIALFKRSQSRIYMIQYNTECINSYFKRILFNIAKNKIDGIICPSKEIGEAYGIPFCVVPDYIYTNNKPTVFIPFTEKLYDFSVLGLICEDKGVIDVAKKFKNTKYKVLIAGKPQNENIKKELINICKNSPNIILKFSYLSEEEYDSSIKNSKYCILNYQGAYSEHSSGVVYDILFKGVPVIGRKCKYLNFIEKNNLGIIYDDIQNLNPDTILEPAKYDFFLHEITIYYQKHNKYISELKKFINI